MTERPWEDFEDLGPVRFPLPEGHPLLDDEDALEAALLHDALASVVGEGDASIFTERIAEGSSHSSSGLFARGWLGGLAGTASSALTGFTDRVSHIVGSPLPAWGEANESEHVRDATSSSSERMSDHPLPSASVADSFHHLPTEYAMSYTEAPKVIGDPASQLVSADVQQQYSDTCAIQCQRLILNEFGVGVTEDQLVAEATARGIYQGGGTSPEDVGKLLESHGLPVNRYDNANVFNLSNELAQGHKVIVGVDSADLWESQNSTLHEIFDFLGFAKADHAVIVSGIDTTDPDHIKVNITDPGTGDVAKSYPIEQFLDAWKGSDFTMVSTAVPAPDTSAGMLNFPYDQGHIPMVGQAPYGLVLGLSESIDPHISPNAMSGVEAQFFDALNGGGHLDPGAVVQVGPFPGDVHVQALFDTYGLHGGHGMLNVAFGRGGHGAPIDSSFEGQLHDDNSLTNSDNTIHHDPFPEGSLGSGLHSHGPSFDEPFRHGMDDDFLHQDV